MSDINRIVEDHKVVKTVDVTSVTSSPKLIEVNKTQVVGVEQNTSVIAVEQSSTPIVIEKKDNSVTVIQSPGGVALETVYLSAVRLSLFTGTLEDFIDKTLDGGGGVDDLSTDPTSPTEGQVWYNTTTHSLKFYNGTEVKTVFTGSSSSGEENVQSDWAETDDTLDSFIKNKENIQYTAPITKVEIDALDVDAGTVDGKTVGVDVPADADFDNTQLNKTNIIDLGFAQDSELGIKDIRGLNSVLFHSGFAFNNQADLDEVLISNTAIDSIEEKVHLTMYVINTNISDINSTTFTVTWGGVSETFTLNLGVFSGELTFSGLTNPSTSSFTIKKSDGGTLTANIKVVLDHNGTVAVTPATQTYLENLIGGSDIALKYNVLLSRGFTFTEGATTGTRTAYTGTLTTADGSTTYYFDSSDDGWYAAVSGGTKLIGF